MTRRVFAFFGALISASKAASPPRFARLGDVPTNAIVRFNWPPSSGTFRVLYPRCTVQGDSWSVPRSGNQGDRRFVLEQDGTGREQVLFIPVDTVVEIVEGA